MGVIAVLALGPNLLEAWKGRCPEHAWYEGGTLGEATIEEWSSATERNRLATAADWAARYVEGADISTEPRDRLFPLSLAFRMCVDLHAPEVPDPEDTMAITVGLACAVSRADHFARLLSHLTNAAE